MKWEKDGSSVEIRTQGELPDRSPALDEVVASGATVHLEQMSHDHWWMGIESGWEILPSELRNPRRALVGSVVGPGRRGCRMGRRQPGEADNGSERFRVKDE